MKLRNIKIKFRILCDENSNFVEKFNTHQTLLEVFQCIQTNVELIKNVELISFAKEESSSYFYSLEDSSLKIEDLSNISFTVLVKISTKVLIPPPKYYCSISRKIIFEGVKIQPCGHTFEKYSCEGWIDCLKENKKQFQCPECNEFIKSIEDFNEKDKEELLTFIKDDLEEIQSKEYLDELKKIKLEKMKIHKLKLKCQKSSFEMKKYSKEEMFSKFINLPIIWFFENEEGFFPFNLNFIINLNEYIKNKPKILIINEMNDIFYDIENMKKISNKNKKIEKIYKFKIEKILYFDCILDNSSSTYDLFTSSCIQASKNLNSKNILNLNLFNNLYQFDLSNDNSMLQINSKTKFSRKIILSNKITRNMIDNLDDIFESKSFHFWQIQLDKGWKNFDPKISILIENEFLKKKPFIKLVIYGKEYKIFFDSMVQVNLQTNFKRNVKRIYKSK
eukprot:gene173-4419_t